MIALIDNYDSFTYNIYQRLKPLTAEEIRVFRNDKVTLAELEALPLTALVISPGPGRPEDAGISLGAVRHFTGRLPILGVCLGHQTIFQAFGGRIVQAGRIVHGKVEAMDHDGRGVFRNLPKPAAFTRYHSLAGDEASLPAELEITARSPDGEIMGVRHREYPVEGVQFHPESIACDDGDRLLINFLNYKREPLDRKTLLGKLLKQQVLERAEAEDFMEELTQGGLPGEFTAAVLAALATRLPDPEEVAGCAGVLARKKKAVAPGVPTLDTCGTGGDGLGTFNISSMTALIAAACGARVAKHGNRAVSSKSGSADFYRELGINIEADPLLSERLIREEGFAFLYAPLFHGAMRHAAPVRRAMGVKTLMNLMGPLVNPAGAASQLIGVYDPDLCPIMARAAKSLGVKRVMVVHAADGQDELSPASTSRVFSIDEEGNEKDETFDPSTLGISGFRTEDLAGGDAEENARMARDILDGGGPAAVREACLINAGAALTVYGQSRDIAEGYALAKDALDKGLVKEKLRKVAEKSWTAAV